MPVGFPPPQDQPNPIRGGGKSDPAAEPRSPSVGPEATQAARAKRGRMLQNYGSFAGLGLQCGASLTACTLGGLWLDRRLGTLPWLLLLGVALGLVGGFYLIVQRAR